LKEKLNGQHKSSGHPHILNKSVIYKNAKATKSQPIGSYYLVFFLIQESEIFKSEEIIYKNRFLIHFHDIMNNPFQFSCLISAG